MKKNMVVGSSESPVYAMGVVGAAIFYISKSVGFWNGTLGLLKAFVWPGFLVYEALMAISKLNS